MNSVPASAPPVSARSTSTGAIAKSPVPIAATSRTATASTSASADPDRPAPDLQRHARSDPDRVGRHQSAAIRLRRTSAMNTGVPITATITPAWSSPGRTTNAADHVGDQEQRRAEHGRVGEHPALVGPADRPAGVRHRQAEEVHRPGGGGGGAAQQGHRDRAADARAPDARSQRPRGVVAEGERVQGARQRERQQGADGHEGHDRVELCAAAAAQCPHRPEVELLEQPHVAERDAVDDGGQRRRQRCAGEREADRRGAAAAGGPDRVDGDRGERGTDEREPDRPRRARHAERQRDDDRRRRARVHAQQPGIGQRVARERLHQSTGDADGRADDHPEQRARHADAVDDRGVLGPPAMEEGVRHVLERDRARAHREAEERRAAQDRNREAEARAASGRPAAGARGRRARSGQGAHQLGQPNIAARLLLGCPNYADEADADPLDDHRRARGLRLRRRRLRAGRRWSGRARCRGRSLPGHDRAQVRLDHHRGAARAGGGCRPARAGRPAGARGRPGRHHRVVRQAPRRDLPVGARRARRRAGADRPRPERRPADREDRGAAARPDPRDLLRHDEEGVRDALEDRTRSSASRRDRSTTAPRGRTRR